MTSNTQDPTLAITLFEARAWRNPPIVPLVAAAVAVVIFLVLYNKPWSWVLALAGAGCVAIAGANLLVRVRRDGIELRFRWFGVTYAKASLPLETAIAFGQWKRREYVSFTCSALDTEYDVDFKRGGRKLFEGVVAAVERVAARGPR